MLVSLITFVVSGIIFIVIAIPLMKRKIKPNSWYGIRIPQTMEDEEIWYGVNAIMGKYIFWWGIFISVLAIYFYLNPTSPEHLMIYILLVILIAGTVLLIIVSYKVSNKISQNNQDKGRS